MACVQPVALLEPSTFNLDILNMKMKQLLL